MNTKLLRKYSNNQEVLKLLWNRALFDHNFLSIVGSSTSITLQELINTVSIPECLGGEPNATIRPMCNDSFSIEEHKKLIEIIFQNFIDNNQQYFKMINSEYLVSYELIFDLLQFISKDVIGKNHLEFILLFIYDKEWFCKIAEKYYIPLSSSLEIIEDMFFGKGIELNKAATKSSNDFLKHMYEKYQNK